MLINFYFVFALYGLSATVHVQSLYSALMPFGGLAVGLVWPGEGGGVGLNWVYFIIRGGPLFL